LVIEELMVPFIYIYVVTINFETENELIH